MTFWVLAGLLAATAAFALVLTGRRMSAAADASGASLAIYKDQLAEIDRDLLQGLLKPEEAEGQRAEIGRRLLAASRAEKAVGGSGRSVPAAVVLLVPLLALVIYAVRGAPQLPDVPRAQRITMARQTGDVAALLVQVEEHLAKNPGDVAGWKLLVPSYMSLGRYSDAAAALDRILQFETPTADLYAELAEALTFANEGLMTADADTVIAEALRLDSLNAKARYYEALSTLQKGKREEALAKLKALLASAPADAPWKATVEEQIKAAAVSARPPVLTDQQMQAADGQTPEERTAMIRGMVDGLDTRLAENGNDLEGWLRLIRARSVLKETDKAREALAKARSAFATDNAAMASIDALAKELDL